MAIGFSQKRFFSRRARKSGPFGFRPGIFRKSAAFDFPPRVGQRNPNLAN